MKQKIIATGAGIALVTLAAVGAFASQDAVKTQEEHLVESSETPTETPTDTPTDEATATETPTETPTEEATATPAELAEEDLDGDDGDVRGIPDDNPSKEPEDGDEECEKGETVVKTTPSGVQVNVPCNAVHKKHDDGELRHGESDDADDDDEDDEDDGEDDEEAEEEEED